MKEPYSKPTLDSMPFSMEMVEATCGEANLPPSYVEDSGYIGFCKTTCVENPEPRS
ncbi:MAG: hypothetical protein JW795_17020 [Chitinivibrionales bacterium]|nr:hypothetical protein [Chitinivibrionales bacterium]